MRQKSSGEDPGQKTEYVGIDLGSHSVKILSVSRLSSGLQVQDYGVVPLFDVHHHKVHKDIITRQIQENVSRMQLRGKQVGVSVPAQAGIIRHISLPRGTKEEVRKSILRESEKYVPFDLGDMVFDCHVIGESPAGPGLTNVLLVAVKKEKIDKVLHFISDLQMVARFIEVEPISIFNLYEKTMSGFSELAMAAVNIGFSTTSVTIAQNGILSLSRSIPVGTRNLTLFLSQQKGIKVEEAQAMAVAGSDDLFEVLEPAMSPLVNEIRNSFHYFEGGASLHLSKMMLSGGGAAYGGIVDFFSKQFALSCELERPFDAFTINGEKIQQENLVRDAGILSVALGCACRDVGA